MKIKVDDIAIFTHHNKFAKMYELVVIIEEADKILDTLVFKTVEVLYETTYQNWVGETGGMDWPTIEGKWDNYEMKIIGNRETKPEYFL